ncbi:MAG: hypothetical protein JWL64_579 [Frankiales bacterium]|nr:hypothetical protein [Frankiales bacterium]
MQVDDRGPGEVRTSMTLPVTSVMPDGRVSLAPSLVLADVAVAVAVITSRPEQMAISTISLSVEHLAAPVPGRRLVAISRATPATPGHPQHSGGEIRDETGLRIATMSAWFLVRPELPGVVPDPPRALVPVPPADLVALLGATSVQWDESGASYGLLVTFELANAAFSLHGGVGAMAALVAAELCVGPEMTVLSSALQLLRAVTVGTEAKVAATVVRRGRRTALIDLKVLLPDGKPALTGHVVAGLTSG